MWNSVKKAFGAAPNNPVVEQKSKVTPAVPKGRIDKVISGKNQRNRMDQAIKDSGG